MDLFFNRSVVEVEPGDDDLQIACRVAKTFDLSEHRFFKWQASLIRLADVDDYLRRVSVDTQEAKRLISQERRLVRSGAEGERQRAVRVTPGIANAFIEVLLHQVPVLEHVRHVPLRMPGETSEWTKGYHDPTRTYVDTRSLGVWDDGYGEEDSFRALTEVFDIVRFREPPDVANTLSLLSTGFARHRIEGGIPAFLITDMADQGIGRFIADATSIILAGKPATEIWDWRTERECQRALEEALKEDPAVIVIDSAKTTLSNDALARYLRAPAKVDPMAGLGCQQKPIVVLLTKRPADVAGTLRLACVTIMVDDDSAGRPSNRELLAKVWANRPKLVRALDDLERLAIAASGVTSKQVLRGFEEWSQVAGQSVHQVIPSGFLGNLDRLETYEDNSELFRLFVAWDWSLNSTTTRNMRLGRNIADDKPTEVSGAEIADFCICENLMPSLTRHYRDNRMALGKLINDRLSPYIGRQIGKYKLMRGFRHPLDYSPTLRLIVLDDEKCPALEQKSVSLSQALLKDGNVSITKLLQAAE